MSEHSIHALTRAADNGGTWFGVGVCLTCEPEDDERSPRKTFSAGAPCPRCGTDGTLEWRWWPVVLMWPTR